VTTAAQSPADPLLDVAALALHYQVPASTLRTWARLDGWRRVTDQARPGRRGRPRVLFSVGDADNSYWMRLGSQNNPLETSPDVRVN
jgi:hypothetical protein